MLFYVVNIHSQVIPQGFIVSSSYIFDTVVIGNQIWMKNNLNAVSYANGDPILNTNDFSSTVSGAYANYANNINNSTIYGKLYNWYAVNDSRGICPVGWSVPTQADFVVLTNYVTTGSSSTTVNTTNATSAGGFLKESGTTHWQTPNTNASDSFGFLGLPGGWKQGTSYTNLGLNAQFWTSTLYNSTSAYRFTLYYNSNDFARVYSTKEFGFSVRCIKK